MEIVLGLITGLVLAGGAVALVLALARRQQGQAASAQAAVSQQFEAQLAALRESLAGEMREMQKRLNESLVAGAQMAAESSRSYTQAVGQVQHRLGELQQATSQMIGIGKDIASLQNILQSPKLRGGLGEFLLAELLKQILPEEHFDLQFTFQSGLKVDAVIRIGGSLIPVDAKFPLENFRRLAECQDAAQQPVFKKEFLRDVKKHIDSIAAKYINPAEKTFDFALMYIPAESVYYEVIMKGEGDGETLAEYAQKKKVIPVSPNSFYSYLMVVAQGLRGMRIEKSAQAILAALGQLETEFRKCMEDFDKVGTHLKNAQAAYSAVEKKMGKIEGRFTQLGQLSGDEAPPLLRV